jgi:hypothetical protein
VSNPDMPADITAAIEKALSEAYEFGLCGSSQNLIDREEARAALDAAILSRVAAAEATRDEALREQKAVVLAEALRDAALARAERLEAALTSDEAVEAACNAFFSDPAAPWSLAVEGAPTLADEVRRRMRASLRAALSPAAEEAASQLPRAWPSGCIKRNSCARNRTCMYAQSPDQCRHFGKDIRADIAAAERDREWAAAAPR